MQAEEARNEAPEKKGVATLTPEEIMAMDLVFTKERLAQAEEKLAMLHLRDVQKQHMEVAKDKAVLMARLGDRIGGRLKSAKIVGKNQLAYELE